MVPDRRLPDGWMLIMVLNYLTSTAAINTEGLWIIGNTTCKRETKKAISLFWKQERANIIRAIRAPTANETEGVADLDW